jgi:RNA polymerase sigma factor (sigma-70 family)
MTSNSPISELLPTRRSLLSRIKNPEDARSWREFYDTYHRLIRAIAVRAGLSADEAEDAVQDTLICVSKNIGKFNTDPARGSFKNWLFTLTRCRVEDLRRKLRRQPIALADLEARDLGVDTAATAVEHRIPDPAATPAEHLDQAWDEEWRRNLQETALEILRHQVKPRHYQIFFLSVIKQQSALTVARGLGTNIGLVYVVKHRLLGKFRQALRNVEAKLDARRVPPCPEGGDALGTPPIDG